MLTTQPYEINVFHGGITDKHIDAEPHKYYMADNFLVSINAKLFTRPGSEILFSEHPQIPAGSQRIGCLIEDFDETVLVQSAKKIYYSEDSAWVTLQGPTGNDVLTGGVTNVVSYAKWNDHIFITDDNYSPLSKIYVDENGDKQVRTAGLPKMGNPTIAGSPGTDAYLYAFIYKYTYKAETVTFEDLGPVTIVQASAVEKPDVADINITNIPELVNSTTYNYDVDNIKVEIYRTASGGDTFYFLAEIDNGVGSYADDKPDADILNNRTIYITGDVQDNDPPPLAKVIHIANNFAWYGCIKTGASEVLKNRVMQSLNNDPDSVPIGNFIDLEDDVIAISSFGQTPIVLCKNSIYRLDGFFDEQGGGILTSQKIDNRVGCVGSASVVQIPNGVCFAGNDGFYFTDGFKVIKLSEEFNDRYKILVKTPAQRRRIYGDYDKENNRVWWSVQTSEGPSDDINMCYICDLRWGIKNDACFTTASNADYFAPTAILFNKTQLVRGDKRGYLFVHKDGLLSDPMIDVFKNVSNWDLKTIIWNYMSATTSFGGGFTRKWVPRVLITAENASNVSIQAVSNSDVNKKIRKLTPIRFRRNVVWGEPLATWGDDSIVWNYDGIIEEQRRFNAFDLRCSYKQIGLTNAYVVVVASDDMTTATVNSNTKQIILDDIVTFSWPANLLGHNIAFEADNYVTEYPISVSGSNTITVLDPSNTLPHGSQKWVIRGYPKDEVLNLLSIIIHFSLLGKTQEHFKPATTGVNE